MQTMGVFLNSHKEEKCVNFEMGLGWLHKIESKMKLKKGWFIQIETKMVCGQNHERHIHNTCVIIYDIDGENDY